MTDHPAPVGAIDIHSTDRQRRPAPALIPGRLAPLVGPTEAGECRPDPGLAVATCLACVVPYDRDDLVQALARRLARSGGKSASVTIAGPFTYGAILSALTPGQSRPVTRNIAYAASMGLQQLLRDRGITVLHVHLECGELLDNSFARQRVGHLLTCLSTSYGLDVLAVSGTREVVCGLSAAPRHWAVRMHPMRLDRSDWKAKVDASVESVGARRGE